MPAYRMPKFYTYNTINKKRRFIGVYQFIVYGQHFHETSFTKISYKTQRMSLDGQFNMALVDIILAQLVI